MQYDAYKISTILGNVDYVPLDSRIIYFDERDFKVKQCTASRCRNKFVLIKKSVKPQNPLKDRRLTFDHGRIIGGILSTKPIIGINMLNEFYITFHNRSTRDFFCDILHQLFEDISYLKCNRNPGGEICSYVFKSNSIYDLLKYIGINRVGQVIPDRITGLPSQFRDGMIVGIVDFAWYHEWRVRKNNTDCARISFKSSSYGIKLYKLLRLFDYLDMCPILQDYPYLKRLYIPIIEIKRRFDIFNNNVSESLQKTILDRLDLSYYRYSNINCVPVNNYIRSKINTHYNYNGKYISRIIFDNISHIKDDDIFTKWYQLMSNKNNLFDIYKRPMKVCLKQEKARFLKKPLRQFQV